MFECASSRACVSTHLEYVRLHRQQWMHRFQCQPAVSFRSTDYLAVLAAYVSRVSWHAEIHSAEQYDLPLRDDVEVVPVFVQRENKNHCISPSVQVHRRTRGYEMKPKRSRKPNFQNRIRSICVRVWDGKRCGVVSLKQTCLVLLNT